MRRAARLPPEQLAPYLIEPPAGPAPLDWSAVFGNGHPIEAEIGFGKGLFLLTASQQSPDVNFLGVEIDDGGQLLHLEALRVDLADGLLIREDSRQVEAGRVEVQFRGHRCESLGFFLSPPAPGGTEARGEGARCWLAVSRSPRPFSRSP